MIYSSLLSTFSLLFLSAAGQTYYDSGPASGISTYYGGNPSGGACGYQTVQTASFPFGFYAACGGNVFNNGYGCGECYEITCIGPENPSNTGCHCSSTTPSVVISCMDQCPECPDTHFDLDPTAMARIVGPGLSGTCGIIETTVRRVACDYNGNIKIRSKTGTSAYWYGLHIDDVAGYGSITSVKIKSSNANAYDTTCTKNEGPSFWVCAGGFPLSLPMSVQLTDSNNQVLSCDGCISSFAGSAEFDFGDNFGVAQVPTTTTTPAPTTTTTSNGGNPTTTTTPAPTTTTTSNGGGAGGYIEVHNFQTTQAYYLTFILTNIDAATCGDTISDVQILENNAWRSYNQYYYENGLGDRYAFDYTGVRFDQMGDISVRIVMGSGREVDLWAIITDLSPSSVFTSTELICDGTLSPTAPTPQPTTKTPTAPTTPYPTAQTVCIDADQLDWRSYNNELKLNGNRFNMKGLSWFGFETGNNDLYGLDKHNMEYYLDFMQLHGFNAIRLPFSQQFMSSSTNRQKYLNAVKAVASRGIFVMADFHSQVAGNYMEGFDGLDRNAAIATWEVVADLLKDEWNVFMADIFNEPHDADNNEWADWVGFTEDAALAIWAKGVNWLAAVEGTNYVCSVINCCWGENLEGVRNTGVTFTEESYGANRFIWSPHVYGADVAGNPYSEAGWQSHWGYLFDGSHPSNQAGMVIGEFGTTYSGGMVNWLDDLITYLIQIDQRNTFYWCLNPNSGDTGGLLQQDWTTPESGKLAALDRLQPSPSKVVYDADANQVCVAFEGGVVPTSTPATTTTTTPAPTTTTTTPEPTTTTTTTTTTTPAPTTTTTTPAPTTTTTTPAPTTTTTTPAPTTTTTTTTTAEPTTSTTTTTPAPTTTTTTPAPTTTTTTPEPTTTTTTTTPAPTTTTTTTPAPTTTTTTPAPTTTTSTPLTPVPTTTTTTTTTTPSPTTTTTESTTTTTPAPTTTTTTTESTTTTTTPAPTTTTIFTPIPTQSTTTPQPTTTTTTTSTTTPAPTTTTSTSTTTAQPTTTTTTTTLAPTTTTTTTSTTPVPTTSTTVTTTSSTTKTPTTATISSADTIIVSNWITTQPYYLTFTVSNINPCITSIQTVQILQPNGNYRNADQYIYEEVSRAPHAYAHRYAFYYNNQYTFDSLLPITLRIDTANGYVQLSQIITDLNSHSTFVSDKTCDDVQSDNINPDDANDDASNGNDDNSATLTMSNCPGANPWWYSVKPNDVPSDVEVTSFEIRDSSENAQWISYTRYEPHNGCYIFQPVNNTPFVLPFDFRIGDNDQQIESNDVITSYTDYAHGNMASNFDSANSNSFYTKGNGSDSNALGIVPIVVIIICAIAVCCIAIGVAFYCRNKRANKGYTKKNKETDSIAMVNVNDKTSVARVIENDESGSMEAQAEQTNIVPVYYD